jgi:hypothetical protein
MALWQRWLDVWLADARDVNEIYQRRQTGARLQADLRTQCGAEGEEHLRAAIELATQRVAAARAEREGNTPADRQRVRDDRIARQHEEALRRVEEEARRPAVEAQRAEGQARVLRAMIRLLGGPAQDAASPEDRLLEGGHVLPHEPSPTGPVLTAPAPTPPAAPATRLHVRHPSPTGARPDH